MTKLLGRLLFLSLLVGFSAHAVPVVQIGPTPVQRFVDGNGNALANGKLFTYVAGTNTKQASYTDSTGATPNTNPVVLNSRGEANVWLDTTKTYKLVLSPSTDSDPPTNSIWTVDNLPGGYAAYVLTNLASTTEGQGADLVGGGVKVLPSVTGAGGLRSLTAATTVTSVVTTSVNPSDGVPGVWIRVPSDVTSADNLGTIVRSADYATRGDWYRVYNAGASAKWFGAKGDGTTDDATALNNAIAAVDWVDLSDGTYLFGSTIQVLKKTKITGPTMDEQINISAPVTLLKKSSLNGAGIYLSSSSAGSILEGFLLDGQAGNGGDGIVVEVNSATLRNISVFRQGRDGVRIGRDTAGANANSFLLDRVSAKSNGRNGIFINDKNPTTLSITGSMTSGSAVLTSTAAFFTSGIVGYTIVVPGAGVAGAALSTTIMTFTDSQHVTLAASASTSVSGSAFFTAADANSGTLIQPEADNNGDGIRVDNSGLVTIVGPLCEGNTVGMQLDAHSYSIMVFGGDLAEGNGTDLAVQDATQPTATGSSVVYGTSYSTLSLTSPNSIILNPKRSTFTPTITFGGASTGNTYSNQYGEYTKLGNKVFASVAVQLSNKGSATGSAAIAGLPFAAANVSTNFGCSIGDMMNMTGLTGGPYAEVLANTAAASLFQSSSTGTNTNLTDAAFTNTSNVIVTCQYETAN